VGGVDITMLAVQSNKLDYSVMVAPEVRTPQDLKGKIVTGTRPGASADTALRLYLLRHGLTPDKDVVFISVADSQQGRFNALVRKAVAGTVLPPPYSTVAQQQGFRELADLRRTDIEYSGTSIAGIGSYIRAHPAALESFLKGYIESLHFFRTQREKSIAGIMKYMRISDRSRAEEGYLLCRYDAAHAVRQQCRDQSRFAISRNAQPEGADSQSGRVLRSQLLKENRRKRIRQSVCDAPLNHSGGAGGIL
jgi:ABC-type nitrate/sulfonate/bicarbonate transport system substrate-binding protein